MDPNATEGYFIGTDLAGLTNLYIRLISSPGGTPTLSPAQNLSLTIPTIADPISVPALGSTPLKLDGIDRRLMNAQMVNGNLWTTHGIQVDANGAGSSTGGRNGMRFYEITNLTGAQPVPSIRQSGTLFDSAASNPLSYWAGSIATSGQGHSVLASSYAGAAARAGVAFAGRLSNDTLGTLSSPTVLATGGGA